MILLFQLDAAQQTILNMEKNLEQEKITVQQFKQQNAQLTNSLMKKIDVLEHRLESVETKLRTNHLCVVCCERRRNVLLLPCSHLVLCSQCFNEKKLSTCVLQDCKRPFSAFLQCILEN